MWGRDPRGNNATCSALCRLSVTSSTIHKQIRPSWCWLQGGWVCVHSKALWISQINPPVILGVPPSATTPADFYWQRFWSFISLCQNPVLSSLSCFPVVPPSFLQANVGSSNSPAATSTTQSTSYQLATALPHVLSASAARLHPSYQSE